MLVNPTDPIRVETIMTEVKTAAAAIGLQFQVVNASEIDSAFATLAGACALRRSIRWSRSILLRPGSQLALQAARHAICASYGVRDYAKSGELMSYRTPDGPVHQGSRCKNWPTAAPSNTDGGRLLRGPPSGDAAVKPTIPDDARELDAGHRGTRPDPPCLTPRSASQYACHRVFGSRRARSIRVPTTAVLVAVHESPL